MELTLKEAKELFDRTKEIFSEESISDIINYPDSYAWKLSKKYADDGIIFTNGCTKFVVIFDDLNWVIKINIDNVIDYCKLEADNYKKAIDANLAYYFASTYPLGHIQGYTLYAQEYAENDEDRFSSEFSTYVRDSDWFEDIEFEDEDDYESAVWDAAYNLTDSDRLEAIFGYDSDLINFCYSNHINDVHEGNYGVKRDGTSVLIDYSGF